MAASSGTYLKYSSLGGGGSGGGSGGGASGIQSINADTTQAQLILGANGISVNTAGGTTTITGSSAAGTGTVTSVSVAQSNGFSGTVATSTTMPVISLSTTITGVIAGGSGMLAVAASSSFPILNQNTLGTAGNITSSSNSTLTSLPNLSLPGSQVTGNILGNAGNITSSSNTTLTSLPNLVLPGSQVSGSILGSAGNITSSSNSTLTTLSALSLPGSQVTGNISGNASNVTGVVAVINGGTSSTALLLNNVILGNGTNAPTFVAPGTSGNALISNGSTWQSSVIPPSGVQSINADLRAAQLIIGANGIGVSTAGGTTTITGSSTAGSVTSVSVLSANGFSGTVASSTTTPVISLQTTVTGVLAGGSGMLAVAASSSFPILNQNTLGTAGNITSSSNSTLTTLNALSLPGSQVTGNISGNASNVTGIVSVINGGTSSSALALNNVILGNGTSAPTFVAPGTSGYVLTSNGTSWVSGPISASTGGGGGSGTVTSVTFTGDGVVLSSSVSAAVTTSGTLTASLTNVQPFQFLGGSSATGSAANPTYRYLTSYDIPIPLSQSTFYVGDGGDLNVTFSGSVTLVRDMFYNNITVRPGASVNCNGWKVFYAGFLDCTSAPTGAFYRGGAAGGNSAGQGGGGGPSSQRPGTIGGAASVGTNGGAGSPAVGNPGGNDSSDSICAGLGGNGGFGGSGSSAGGGAAGTVSAIVFAPNRRWTDNWIRFSNNSTSYQLYSGGAYGGAGGGGGGSGAAAGGGGGSGGGGAGCLFFSGTTFIRQSGVSSTGIFQVNGGVGGNGFGPGTANTGGGAGGGGGGGGLIWFSYLNLSGTSAANIFDVSGGAGGNGGIGGTGGTGGAGGGSGFSGVVQTLNLTTGQMTYQGATSGIGGGASTGTTAGTGAPRNSFLVGL